MNENGLYTIKDKFFEDFPDKYLKGNKEGNRPHYYSFKDKKTGLNWVIPCTTKIQRCRDIEIILLLLRYLNTFFSTLWSVKKSLVF